MVLTAEAIGPFHLGEVIFFWAVAVAMVALAIGVALCRKAVHSAVCMIGVMLCLAMIYAAQGAYFMAVVQVVVYTGAVMALILFIIMMVGISASDNYLKTSRSLRLGAWGLGIVGAAITAMVLVAANLPATGGVPAVAGGQGNVESNPVQIALTLFREHMFTMEIVSGLLIVAAVGAMLLTHAERLRAMMMQPETAHMRMLEYGEKGTHPGQRPAPGVYTETNAADMPAINAETSDVEEKSIMPALAVLGTERNLAAISPKTKLALHADQSDHPEKGLHSVAASRSVKRSGAWGMKGEDAISGLQANQTRNIPAVVVENTPTQDDQSEEEA